MVFKMVWMIIWLSCLICWSWMFVCKFWFGVKGVNWNSRFCKWVIWFWIFVVWWLLDKGGICYWNWLGLGFWKYLCVKVLLWWSGKYWKESFGVIWFWIVMFLGVIYISLGKLLINCLCSLWFKFILVWV